VKSMRLLQQAMLTPTHIPMDLMNPKCLQAMHGDFHVRRISSTTRWSRPNDP
jgi:hypothetical protein